MATDLKYFLPLTEVTKHSITIKPVLQLQRRRSMSQSPPNSPAGDMPSRLPLRSGWRMGYVVDLPPSAGFFYRGRSGLTPWEHGPVIQHVSAFEAELTAQDYLIVGDEASRQYVLVGATRAHRSMTYLTLRRRQGVFTEVLCEQPDTDSDNAEPVVLLEGDDWPALLVKYAELALQANDAAPPRDTVANVTGYCSWYYYYQHITESQFQENVAALVAHRSAFPARFVQIDDGYQPHQGDWLTRNSAWPTPLPDLASRWTQQGLIPGIWLMPMLVSTASRLFAEHPDWVVRRPDGQPWLVAGWSPPPEHRWACLDASLPAVGEHLVHLFQTLWAWGFRYFKLDGMGFAMPPGRRHDDDATPVSAYRTGLSAIRQAVPQATLLGCATPYLPSLGLVDHSRVGVDTAPAWRTGGLPDNVCADLNDVPFTPSYPSLYNALRGTLSQWWQVDRWFRADPDVVIVRDEKTRLTAGEVRLSLLMAVLTGVTFTSDHLGRISAERLQWLGKAAQMRLRDATPLIWHAGHDPRAFKGNIAGKYAVALMNLQDKPFEVHFCDLGLPATCTDLLRDMTRQQTVTVPAHDALLLTASGAK